MKLSHCADFHLDAPLHTNLPPESARQRRTELMQTFGRMAEYAQREGVAAVLIAGDLFDSSVPRREVLDYVTDTIGKYPDIQFYFLRGNHEMRIKDAKQYSNYEQVFSVEVDGPVYTEIGYPHIHYLR